MQDLLANPRRLAGPAAALLIALVLIVQGQKQALVSGTIAGAAYGALGLGLVLIYKSSGVFNFAQGEFATVAVFALYLLHSSGVPYLFAMVGALLASVLLALVVERVVVRPLFDAPRVTLLVATAGVALLTVGVEIWLGEAKGRPIAPALPRLGRLAILGVRISDQQLLLIAVLLALAAGLAYFFNRTNLGLAVLAASQEPTATELIGVSVRRISSFTWGLAGLIGGLAGILVAPTVGTFGPGTFTRGALILAFTAAVLGGMTSLPGAFLGGVIVGIAQAVAVNLQGSTLADIPGAGSVVVFVLLVGVLAVRPQGLLGRGA